MFFGEEDFALGIGRLRELFKDVEILLESVPGFLGVFGTPLLYWFSFGYGLALFHEGVPEEVAAHLVGDHLGLVF
jgi:hypothetical protein